MTVAGLVRSTGAMGEGLHGAAARSPLVGRADELGEIDGVLDRLRRRQPQVGVEIVGEAGLGKSTLLAELERRAAEFGATVLHGRASQFERDLPFGALLTALEGLDHDLDRAASALRHQAHDRVRALLGDLARDQRVVLAIDDLHWADAATLDLVGSLIERPPRGAFLLVVAYRPHQADGALPPVIATAAARGALRRVDPQPLGLAATAELLGDRHSRKQVGELHGLTGGNPYLLVEIARAIRAGSWTPPAPDHRATEERRGAVPPLLIDALATELLPLDDAARRLLDAAAVLGDPFDVDLAARVAELDAEGATRAVDQLTSTGLVRAAAAPGQFRFRHPLTRQAIHDAAPAGSRRLAHRRAAQALTEAGAELPAVAHHVAQSAEHGDMDAVALLENAGRAILPRSPASAAEWLTAAWRLLRVQDRTALERQTLLYPLSVALGVRGRADEALTILGEALATVEPRSTEARRLALGFATVEGTTGRTEQARRRIQQELADPTNELSLVRVQMWRLVAVCSFMLGDLRTAREAIAGALRDAEALGVPELVLACRSTEGYTAYLDGDLQVARAAADENGAAFAELDDAVLPWLIDEYVAQVRLSIALDHPDPSPLIDRALRATADGLRPILVVDLLAARSLHALRVLDVHEALFAAQAASDEAKLLTDFPSMFYAETATAAAVCERETGTAAFDAADRAVAAAQRYGMPATIAVAGSIAAAARLAAGEPDRAAAIILDTHGGESLSAAQPSNQVSGLAMLTEAAIATGDLAAARAHAAAGDALASRYGLPSGVRATRRARARLALAGDGDPERALDDLREVAYEAASAGFALESAATALLIARAHEVLGERDAAVAELRRVERVLARGGAGRLHGEVTRALRRLGRRASRTARRPGALGPEHLTARQREIAQLAATGRSNREIAEQLVLSVKTVESHLGAAFATLGVRSRPELRERLS